MNVMAMGAAHVIQGNARHLPLPDDSVDLIITSPPYFALRSYQDGGEHYEGQIGSEPTPAEFLDALLEVTRECVRVLRPAGSLWVNLGDKYVADNRGSGADGKRGKGKHAPAGPAGYPTGGMPHKSLMGLPWRYAIRCIDELGLILRRDQIWSKPNGLPESTTDRCRSSHEYWFHFTTSPRYFAAIDEIREPHTGGTNPGRKDKGTSPKMRALHATGDHGRRASNSDPDLFDPRGKLPGSVWTVPSEPLIIPDYIAHARCCAGAADPACEDGLDHFAAFPSEWPRKIIKGWGPTQGVCTVCGEGRRPVVDKVLDLDHVQRRGTSGRRDSSEPDSNRRGLNGDGPNGRTVATITGYVCACNEPIPTPVGSTVDDPSQTTGRAGFNRPRDGAQPPRIVSRWEQQHEASQLRSSPHAAAMRAEAGTQAFDHYVRTDRTGARAIPEPLRADWRARGWLVPAPPFMPPPTRPGVVLDVFGGTGTTAMVAKALGMVGITVDMSADYCRLAQWRTNDRDQLAKVLGIGKAPDVGGHDLEDDLFTLLGKD